jgi:hypothetical protein
MIILLMVLVLLALAWGLADHQLSAPIERPEPPIPAIVKPRQDVPPTPEAPQGETPQADAVSAQPEGGGESGSTPEPTPSLAPPAITEPPRS